jgi:hypothetical protein
MDAGSSRLTLTSPLRDARTTTGGSNNDNFHALTFRSFAIAAACPGATPAKAGQISALDDSLRRADRGTSRQGQSEERERS